MPDSSNGTIVVQPAALGGPGVGGAPIGGFEIPQAATFSFVAQFAEAADTIPAWGTTPGLRDRALRAFWPGEPLFASALYDTVAKYAGFQWSLEGGPRTVAAVQDILNSVEQGRGWYAFVTKILVDLFTQDNGAFIEVVRTADDPAAPVAGLNHLDSGRCVRTGRWDAPVVYYDLEGQGHRLKSYQVITLEEFPSPQETMRGLQYCALTRILRIAQIMRDIEVYKREKISGRFTKAIHLVGGMSTKMIGDALVQHQANADNQGLVRFMQPLVLGTLDPTAKVDYAKIDLAGLPDGYDEETTMRWYITHLAMAFGTDYQDFAPLPGRAGAAGSSAKVLAAKARGKGPELFMNMLQHMFNWHGVMPRNVRFSYTQQDPAAQTEKLQQQKEYALYLQICVEAGIITPQVARQMLVDQGYMRPEYLELMRDPDPTNVIIQPGGETIDPVPTVKPGVPGPVVPPAKGSAGGPPTPNDANNNALTTMPISQSQRPIAPAGA